MDGAVWLGWLARGGSFGAGNTGKQARPEGQGDSICKVPFLLYTEVAGIHARVFL